MTQLSRPFQIALLAMGLFVAVWFVALRGHSPSAGGSSSPAPASAPAPSASSQAEKAGGPSSVYHGSAPGVAGLTHAIAKAHGAVAESQQNAKTLQEKSAQASSPTSTGAAAGAPTAGSQPKSSATSTGSATTHPAGATHPAAPAATVPPAATSKSAPKGAGSSSASANAAPAKQVQVEKELKQGRTVILLFWSPSGADDVVVRRSLQLLQAFHRADGTAQNRTIVVHEARANQVVSFGTITRAVQINQTPTIVIITPTGKTKTVTGITDPLSIQQAISEARK
jgi:hypothetical protein